MATAFNTRKRIRRFFGHIETVAPMPNLIEVQKSSYESFLQRVTPAAKRTQSGLQEVFRSGSGTWHWSSADDRYVAST